MGAPSPVSSPCTGVCTIDKRDSICIGCLRTLDEIARWRDSTDNARRAILLKVAERKATRS